MAAVGSIVGAGSLAAAAMAESVPQAVTMPIGPDPIYAVIERHRKACEAHTEAVRIKFAFEEADMKGEKLQEYYRLDTIADEAYDRQDDAGLDLINTAPTTLGGILALCRYMKPQFEDCDASQLPEYITYDDDTEAYPAEALCHSIGVAIEALIKVLAGKAVQS